MRSKIYSLALGVLLVTAALPAWAESKGTCLNYWSVGMSGCGGQGGAEKTAPAQPAPPVAPQPASTAEQPTPSTEQPKPNQEAGGQQKEDDQKTAAEKKEEELQKKIDKFYSRYNKPPEEFVRFQLDPTVENALAWAQKYNEMISQGDKLAKAWDLAQQLYTNYIAKGVAVPDAVLKENADKLADLPGLHLPTAPLVPGGPPKGAAPDAPAADAGVVDSAIGLPMDPSRNLKVDASGRISGTPALLYKDENPAPAASAAAPSTYTPPPAYTAPAPAAANQYAATGQPLHISYYFSAECPFCKKFMPGFKTVLAELGDRARVTCVDMTPSGQKAENITGTLNCDWRPLMPGEKDAYGISATPTLIVDRGQGGALERLSGYVDEEKLRNYLTKGPQLPKK